VEQAADLFLLLTRPVRANYERAVQQSQLLLHDVLATVTAADIAAYNHDHAVAPCLLLFDRNTLLLAFTASHHFESTTSYEALCHEIDRNIEICNYVLTLRWSSFVNTIKLIMKPIKIQLKHMYVQEINVFWKQQQIVHTRR
jgi:hypothetical protein